MAYAIMHESYVFTILGKGYLTLPWFVPYFINGFKLATLSMRMTKESTNFLHWHFQASLKTIRMKISEIETSDLEIFAPRRHASGNCQFRRNDYGPRYSLSFKQLEDHI